VHGSYRLDARQGSDPFEERTIEGAIGDRRCVLLLLKVDGKGECAFGDEPEIDLQEVPKASYHQAAADEEDDREGDLGAHEESRDTEAATVHPRASAPASQRGRDREPGGDPGWNQGHRENRDYRGREREDKCATVESHIREAWDAGRAEGGDCADGPRGQYRSGDGTRQR
jgi:hypothetical protein